MSDDEMLEDVRSWLDQHGYVLEMEVAQEFMSHCEYVIQGDQYIDPITSKLRETDVCCSWSDAEASQSAIHFVDMVAECKSTTAPWVAFFGGSTSDALSPYVIDKQRADCPRCEEIANGIYELGPTDAAPKAYAITEKRSGRSGTDHAREAVLSVASASIAKMQQADESRSGYTGHYSWRILPIVVTKSPIVSCSLNDNGNVNLSLTPNCWVSVVHEKSDFPVLVLVITYAAFHEFVTELVAMYGRLRIA